MGGAILNQKGEKTPQSSYYKGAVQKKGLQESEGNAIYLSKKGKE